MADDVNTGLTRFTAACASSLVSIALSRDWLGKGYFELGVNEKAMVDHSAHQLIAANYQKLTAEFLLGQTKQPAAGFADQTQKPKA